MTIVDWAVVPGMFCVLWAAVAYLGIRTIAGPHTNRANLYAGGSALAAALVVGIALSARHHLEVPAVPAVVAGQSFSCARVFTAAARVAHGSIDNVQTLPNSVTVSSAKPIERTQIVVARGWATDAEVHHTLAGVCLFIDGKPLARQVVSYGSSRPDVARVFNDTAVLNSGFEIRVPASAVARGRHRLEVAGVDGSGHESAIAPPMQASFR